MDIPKQSWMPFGRGEIPASLTPEMEKAAKSLSVCLDELRRLIGFYELFVALDEIYDDLQADTLVRNSVANVSVSLLRNMLNIIPALFDTDPQAVNLRNIINVMLDARSSPALFAFHNLHPNGRQELKERIAKLRTKKRIINGAYFKRCLSTITKARHKLIAHYDVEEGMHHAELKTRNIQYVFLISSHAAILCAGILTSRLYYAAETKAAAADQAKALASAIASSMSTSSTPVTTPASSELS